MRWVALKLKKINLQVLTSLTKIKNPETKAPGFNTNIHQALILNNFKGFIVSINAYFHQISTR